MDTIRHWMWNLPARISDPVVVIDVFSATSNIISYTSRAKDVFLVNAGNIHEAIKRYPDAVTAGEGYVDVRFDIPNAFDRAEEADVTGKTVLYMSINGSKAIEKSLASGAPEVLAGAFVNLSALIAYLQKQRYTRIVMVLSGDEGTETVEDAQFANVLESVMNGKKYDWEMVTKSIRAFMKSYYRIGLHEQILGRVLARDIYTTVPNAKRSADGLISF